LNDFEHQFTAAYSVLMIRSARGITLMIQKRLERNKRDMILDSVTLKQGKTHCGR